jgi:hypothetical protein
MSERGGGLDKIEEDPELMKLPKCHRENVKNPDYENSLKLQVINHGNCDFCEVSI